MTLEKQLESARRELGLRTAVYPGFIAKGRMTREAAERETECMRCIAATLDKLVAAKIRGESTVLISNLDSGQDNSRQKELFK